MVRFDGWLLIGINNWFEIFKPSLEKFKPKKFKATTYASLGEWSWKRFSTGYFQLKSNLNTISVLIYQCTHHMGNYLGSCLSNVPGLMLGYFQLKWNSNTFSV